MTTFIGLARARLSVKLAPLGAKVVGVAGVVGAFAAQFAVWSLVLGGVALVVAMFLQLWGAHYEDGHEVTVELTDTSLRFSDGGVHTFGGGSLVAVRRVHQELEHQIESTEIQAELDSGKLRVLEFMDLVTDDRLSQAEWRKSNIRFDPSQNDLLQRLQARLPRTFEGSAGYTIRLRGEIGEPWPFDTMCIEGNMVTLRKAGAPVAIANVADIRCEPYTFKGGVSPYPDLALRITFLAADVTLEVGAHAAWSYRLPAALPQGDGPFFLVGAAELQRIKAALDEPATHADGGA